jgi:hypothetical protein
MELTFLYQLIPSAISIFLVLSTPLSNSALEKRMERTTYSDPEKETAKKIAKDWGTRLAFHSAMLAAIAGAVAVATDPIRPWLLVVAVILLGVVSFALQMYLWGVQIGRLYEGRRIKPAKVCDAVLVFVNVLIVMMFLLNDPERRAALGELLAGLAS